MGFGNEDFNKFNLEFGPNNQFYDWLVTPRGSAGGWVEFQSGTTIHESNETGPGIVIDDYVLTNADAIASGQSAGIYGALTTLNNKMATGDIAFANDVGVPVTTDSRFTHFAEAIDTPEEFANLLGLVAASSTYYSIQLEDGSFTTPNQSLFTAALAHAAVVGSWLADEGAKGNIAAFDSPAIDGGLRGTLTRFGGASSVRYTYADLDAFAAGNTSGYDFDNPIYVQYTVFHDVSENPTQFVIDVTSPNSVPVVTNTPPVAVDDVFNFDFGTSDVFLFPLTNDTDADGDSLRFVDGVTVVSGGDGISSLEAFDSNGEIEIRFFRDFSGTIELDYDVEDSNGGVDTGRVTINIAEPPNSPPDTTTGFISGDEDTTITGDLNDFVTDPDGDTLEFQLVGDPSDIGVVLNADGTFTITPDANFNGSTEFQYQVTDTPGFDDAIAGLALVDINPVNDAPVAGADDIGAVLVGDELVINVADLLANDTDPEGDALSITAVDGAVLDTQAGTVTFTGATEGATSFTYTLSDGDLTDTGSVAVLVEPKPLNVIRGNRRSNRLRGTDENDYILGLGGRDWLNGREGDDILNGGRASDVYTGGAGADQFVIRRGYGVDFIRDFEQGTDLIALQGNTTFDDLTLGVTRRGNGFIRVGNDTLAQLDNFDATTLTANDFIAFQDPLAA